MSTEDGQEPSLDAQSVPLCPPLRAGRVRRNVTPGRPRAGRASAARRRLAGRSTVTITILYGKRAAGRGSSLREAVRARAGRGRTRARAGSAVTLRAKL